jgi:hypothetical protein
MRGSVTLGIYSENLPPAPGSKGTISIPIGGSNPYAVHIVLEKLTVSSTVAGKVMATFEWRSDSTSGSRTRAS